MKSFEIRNERVISLLEQIRYLYRDKYDVQQTNNMLGSDDDDHNYWLSETYRDAIIGMGTNHHGGPANARSYALKPDHYKGNNPEYASDFNNVSNDIMTELGIRVNALSQLYPPQGFISWHNNADAPGYNLIFTWSETGDGWFKYIDEDGKEVTMQDTKGWSLKAGYFGDYDDGKLCYHAAYTNCWRMTHSFVVGDSYEYWADCIAYISE